MGGLAHATLKEAEWDTKDRGGQCYCSCCSELAIQTTGCTVRELRKDVVTGRFVGVVSVGSQNIWKCSRCTNSTCRHKYPMANQCGMGTRVNATCIGRDWPRPLPGTEELLYSFIVMLGIMLFGYEIWICSREPPSKVDSDFRVEMGNMGDASASKVPSPALPVSPRPGTALLVGNYVGDFQDDLEVGDSVKLTKAYTKKQKGRNIRIPVWSIGVIEKISASTGKVLVEFKYSDDSGQHAMKGTEWFTKDQLDKGLLARASEAQKAIAQQKLQDELTTFVYCDEAQIARTDRT